MALRVRRVVGDRRGVRRHRRPDNDVGLALRPGRTRLVWVETRRPTHVGRHRHRGGVRYRPPGGMPGSSSTPPWPRWCSPVPLCARCRPGDAQRHQGPERVTAHVSGWSCRVPARRCLRAAGAGLEAQHGNVPGPMEALAAAAGYAHAVSPCAALRATVLALADRLDGHPALTTVLYPGLASHPVMPSPPGRWTAASGPCCRCAYAAGRVRRWRCSDVTSRW